MYNNFSSKKTKKVISALLATALVATSAPITADAATSKVVGVGKTITYNAKAKVKKVTVKNKKIVTAKKSGKKVTLKGKKAGKTTVTIKTTKKTIKLTVKVGATSITKKTVTTSMNVGATKNLKVNAVNGKGDTIKFTSNKKAVVKVNKASAVANKNKVASTTVTALKAGTAKITATSKFTGKKKTFTIKVAADAVTPTPTTTGAAVVTTPSVSTTPTATTPGGNAGNQGGNATDVPQTTTGAATTTAPAASEDPDVTTNPGVTGEPTQNPDDTQNPDQTQKPDDTQNPDVTTNPAITTEPAVTTAPAVVSLSAVQTGRQTIIVTGTNLSSDVADYTVKRGNSAVSITSVTVSEDKATATLTAASSSLAAGDYTVTLGTEVASLTVAAEEVSSVEIIGTNLVVADKGAAGEKATIGYKILNQFGERMTGNVVATSSLGETTVTAASRTANGTIEVTLTNGATLGSTVGSLVLVETGSGKSATATVTVSAKAAINKVDVLGLYDISGEPKVATLNTDSDAANHVILFKAYDQYGSELTTLPVDDVTITVSGATGLEKGEITTFETETVNNETYFKIPLAGNLSAGTSIVTIVGNSVGLLATVNVEVTKPVKVASITIDPKDTLYVGTKTEIEYSATDTNGNAVTDYATLNKLGATPFNNNTDFTWERQADGSAKLYLTPSVGAGKTLTDTPTGKSSKTAVLTSQIDTNVHPKTVAVYAQKTCTAIVGLDNTVAKAALLGETISYKQEDFIIQDQYGNVMTDDEVAAETGTIYVKATIDNTAAGFGVDSFTDNVLYSSNTVSDEKTAELFSITADATNAGTTVVTFSLATAKDGSNDIANSDTQVTLKSTTLDKVTNFALDALPTIFTDGTNQSTVDLNVTGKLGNLTVTIPSGSYTAIGTDHLDTTTTAGKVVGKGTVEDSNSNPTSKTETLEIVIKNTEGTSIKQDVTVSSEARKVTKVALAGATFEVAKSASDTVNYATDLVSLLKVTDQYENKTSATAGDESTPRVVFTNLPTGFSVADNNTTAATLTVAGDAGAIYTVDVTLTYPSGVVYTGTLVITIS